MVTHKVMRASVVGYTNAILVIVNRYIKFLGYFAVIIIIIVAELADLFLE